MRRMIVPVILGFIAAALCATAPTALLRECWRVAEGIDAPEATRILAQLKDAHILPSVAACAGCGAAVTLTMRLLRRQWLGAVIISGHIAVAGMLAALMYTTVNGVPVHTAVRIIVEYALSGAFQI